MRYAIVSSLVALLLAAQVGCGNDGGTGGGGGHGGDAGGNSVGAGGDGGVAVGGGAAVWQPVTGTTWQWQLTGLPVDTSFDVAAYDIDMFDSAPSLIDALHADGRVVICYFSAGSWEDFRPDAGAFPDGVKGAALDPPFQDELWLDVRDATVRDLMRARLDLAVGKGCDAVEPDNVDGYANSNGLGLTAADQLDYNRFIANEAHARGMSVGLKNDIDQLADLVDDFDWALNEECHTYAECDAYQAHFSAQNKAVFHAEYIAASQLAAMCAVTKPLGLSSLIKNIDLDAYALPCP